MKWLLQVQGVYNTFLVRIVCILSEIREIVYLRISSRLWNREEFKNTKEMCTLSCTLTWKFTSEPRPGEKERKRERAIYLFAFLRRIHQGDTLEIFMNFDATGCANRRQLRDWACTKMKLDFPTEVSFFFARRYRWFPRIRWKGIYIHLLQKFLYTCTGAPSFFCSRGEL